MDQAFQLPINNGPNSLHGGLVGLDKQIWQANLISPTCIEFTFLSPHMDQGYPGTVEFKVTYSLAPDTLQIHLGANLLGDAEATYVNLTAHSYFNLSNSPTIHDHVVHFPGADQAFAMDETQIPTGQLLGPLNNPGLFFLEKSVVGPRLNQPQLSALRGFDHFYLTKQPCFIECPSTKVGLKVWSDVPGFQFYTGNWISEALDAKQGGKYGPYAGLCIEPSYPPNSINMSDYADHVMITPTKPFQSTISYQVYSME